ncbi:MAG TPA: PQQ-binding-like beta-propeller repeat protein [Verrucomicrobiae bacterium]|nr:PQQ-binding-like beta-propeller repeat protein [Verrucomicrobiae bacterium]
MHVGQTILLAATLLYGLDSSGVAAEFDWPRWRGPDCNGISKETGWSTRWPSAGPRQLWKTQIGLGFSSFVVAENRVYTMGHRNGQDVVWCLDTNTAREIWKHRYTADLDARLYEGGPNSTPTLDDKLLFTLGRHGQLFCLDASDGSVIWKTDLMKDHGLTEPGQDWWGFSGSPLVEGDFVILNAGTHGMAFNKKTGKLAWSTGKGANGYASPVPFDAGGRQGVAVFAAKSLGTVDAKTGQELWVLPWKTPYDINAADPIFSEGHVFVSSGYRTGGGLFKLDGNKLTEVWKSQEMHNQMNPSVLLSGHLYGISGQQGHGGDLRCVEFMTGKVRWKGPELGVGSVMAADGKLIVLGERGELLIAEAKPDAFKALARAQVLGGRCWTSPVLSHGRIFCRNSKGDCVCLDVRGAQTARTD